MNKDNCSTLHCRRNSSGHLLACPSPVYIRVPIPLQLHPASILAINSPPPRFHRATSELQALPPSNLAARPIEVPRRPMPPMVRTTMVSSPSTITRGDVSCQSAGTPKSVRRQSSTSSPAGFAASPSPPKAPVRPPCLALYSSPLGASTGEPYWLRRRAMVSPHRAPHY
jgi:hypothetical protein